MQRVIHQSLPQVNCRIIAETDPSFLDIMATEVLHSGFDFRSSKSLAASTNILNTETAPSPEHRGPAPPQTSNNHSADDSAYTPPTSGWLSRIPSSWVPYVQLMRLDRPNGFYYFWLPHVFGTLHAAHLQPSRPIPLLQINLILFFGTVVMRGATCTFNDLVDAPFDRLVARCRHRAIARGAVSVAQAVAFIAAQTMISLGFLALLPVACAVYSIPAIIGWIIYPLAKRVTYYPQVVLGFPMAWGVLMGEAAMGLDPLQLLAASPQTTEWMTSAARGSVACLYAANVVWTLLYEIIYSHQDAAEDIKAGVKNIVILYEGQTKPLLTKLAAAQVVFLASAGLLGGTGPLYFIGSVVGAAVTLGFVVKRVNLEIPQSCAWWFKYGCCFLTGGTMLSGFLGQYVATIYL